MRKTLATALLAPLALVGAVVSPAFAAPPTTYTTTGCYDQPEYDVRRCVTATEKLQSGSAGSHVHGEVTEVVTKLSTGELFSTRYFRINSNGQNAPHVYHVNAREVVRLADGTTCVVNYRDQLVNYVSRGVYKSPFEYNCR